jgi:hypothetical protein
MADRSKPWAQTPTGNVLESLPLDIDSDDHTPDDVPNGFHCNTSGDLVGQLHGDTADRTFAMLAGVYYPYRFTVVRDTSTADGLFLYTI